MGESFVVRRFFKGFQSLLPSDFYLFYKDLPPKLAGRTEKYTSLERSYGSLAAVIIIYTPVDVAAQHERVERIVVEGKDKDAFAFKQAVTNECSMTAVAGAIIAQVAITALSLPNLSATHWVAQAFFLFPVTSGCLSVFFCCVVQRTIGTRYHADSMRDWLTLPPNHLKEGSEDQPARASLAAVVIISAPFTIMKVSIYAFLLGLSIYQGFIWTRGLDTGAGLHDSRDVFITFMVGSGACLLYYFMTFRLKSVQDDTMYDGEEKIGVSDAVHLNTLTGSAQVPFGTDHTQNVPQTLHQELESQDLVAALEVAAQAHLKCAEADQKVASLYSVANQVGSNRNNETTQAGDVIPG